MSTFHQIMMAAVYQKWNEQNIHEKQSAKQARMQ